MYDNKSELKMFVNKYAVKSEQYHALQNEL